MAAMDRFPGWWPALVLLLAAAAAAPGAAWTHERTARRALHMRGGNAHAPAGASDGHACVGSACQLMVRVARAPAVAASSLRGRLLAAAQGQCLHYIPHDAFLGLFVGPSAVQELKQLPGVESVHRIEPELKMAHALMKAIASGDASHTTITLDVLCCECSAAKMLMAFAQTSAPRALFTQASESKVVVKTTMRHLNQTASWLNNQHDVFFLDVKLQAKIFNFHTSHILKGEPAGADFILPPLRLLQGEDEVVGVADTGERLAPALAPPGFAVA